MTSSRTSSNTQNYSDFFPNYCHYKHSKEEAECDIKNLEKLSKDQQIVFDLSRKDDSIILNLYSSKGKLSLSETMPILENLGFFVIEEQSYKVPNLDNTLIQTYILKPMNKLENFDELKNLIIDALYAFYSNITIADSLSKLTTYSGISWRDIDLIRTVSHYIHQVSFQYDFKYVNETLIKHYGFTKKLIELFQLKFDLSKHDTKKYEELAANQLEYLTSVTSSVEDKILRTVLRTFEAATRTNFFQNSNNQIKNYISIKFDSKKVPGIPKPTPYAEIFVFSKEFEGIHLRGSKVARGGIRWSDRAEDYRTEVLGLMKAQMTKNTVIVPDGSKGGFFVRSSPDGLTRDEYMRKVVNCYQNFLRGLLDLTDNLASGNIVKPKNVITYDEDDPYLVVAADKGTASFSDYANEVSAEYNFWLGDAFASGGSAGYDHKKIAITARGAWISVSRHFKEIGIDAQKDEITVVGIGDMAGDVFGNGLLMSESIKLVAAFNHMHIFIDPSPNPLESFKERKRLFNLPGSKWSDYDAKILSSGAGIFERKSKLITLSKEASSLLDLTNQEVTPDELIRAIIKSKVDLIWNGGIGTYVKASSEENYKIGDKTNDNLRINGNEIKARVIGEGGNLGMSQKGRIEYAKNGGKLNTDFIDNSAGVDCSDHEVNIKIALSKAFENKKLNLKDRNELLESMTKQVADLVLKDNISQSLAITFMEHSNIFNTESFAKLINSLEEEKLLDRNVEFIPSNSELIQRSNNKEKLTRPEIAVLLSYSKMSVYNDLAGSKIASDEFFKSWLIDYFPSLMREKFRDEIMSHPLKNEIIITMITNRLVNQLSGPILSSLKLETGALLCDIARGFVIVQEIFDLNLLWNEIDNLPSNVPLKIVIEMFTDLNKVIRRGIAWMVSNLEHPLNIRDSIAKYKESVLKISDMLTKNLYGPTKDKYDTKYQKYLHAKIPDSLAEKAARLESLVSAFDIAFISNDTGEDSEVICEGYFKIGNLYNIDWLRKAADKLITDSYWQRLSLQAIKDDLYDKQRRLIKIVVKDSMIYNIDDWYSKNMVPGSTFNKFVENIKLQENIDMSMLILANKKLEMFIRKV